MDISISIRKVLIQLNTYIDHTLLKATATKQDIIELCEQAKRYKFHAVCVNSGYVALAKEQLNNSSVKVCSVVGFPLGAMATQAKVAETQEAIKNGADEIDMVINVGLLKSKDFDGVWRDIEAVKCILPNHILKVILETCYLEELEIIKSCELAVQCGADFVKTSTGFGPGGARFEEITIMKRVVAQSGTKIKASGGIRDTETALKYINMGVARIGTSSGIEIVSGTISKSDY